MCTVVLHHVYRSHKLFVPQNHVKLALFPAVCAEWQQKNVGADTWIHAGKSNTVDLFSIRELVL